MSQKTRKIFGIITAVAVGVVVVYSVKKYYDSKKQEEQAIDVEEAKRMVGGADPSVEASEEQIEEHKHEARSEAYDKVGFRQGRKMEDLEDETPRVIAFKAGEEVVATIYEEEEEEDDNLLDGFDPQEIQDAKGYFEEDKDVIDDLKYEPNSVEAREQFINMELANLGRDNDTRDIAAMLYDHPFSPKCDEDQNLKVRLVDHRIKFFGLHSRWNNQITFGDVILYYGKNAEFNCGNDVRYWVNYFLDCANLNDILLTSDDIDDRIKVLNGHNFFNEDTHSFGLFGLTSGQMTEACSVAKARIDEQVTYDIEFNVFMQGVI